MTVLDAIDSLSWRSLALGDLQRLMVRCSQELQRHHVADRGFANSPDASEAMDAACQAQQTAVDQLDAAMRLLETPVDYGWMEAAE
jgi:hypothetical protein